MMGEEKISRFSIGEDGRSKILIGNPAADRPRRLLPEAKKRREEKIRSIINTRLRALNHLVS
jgi:hypothetical protein